MGRRKITGGFLIAVLAVAALAGPAACKRGDAVQKAAEDQPSPVGGAALERPAEAAAVDEGMGEGRAAGASEEAAAAWADEGLVLAPAVALCSVGEGEARASRPLAQGARLAFPEPKAEPILAKDASGREGRYRLCKTEDGAEGYVELGYVGLGRRSVLVGDRITTFTEAKSTKASGDYLPGATLVVATTGGLPAGFAACDYWAPGSGSKTTVFVERKSVSDRSADIAAVGYLAEAAASPAKAKELLEKAQRDCGDSAFAGLIASRLAGLAASPEPVVGRYLVSVEGASVRETPDAVFGAVVAELKKGEAVEAVEISAKDEILDGATARWVRIAKPAGWVFGAFLAERK
jgi:hypothetical protein